MKNIELKEEFLNIKPVNPDQEFTFSEAPSVDNYIKINTELTNLESVIIDAIISAAAGKYLYGNRKIVTDGRKLGPYKVNLKRERYDNRIRSGIRLSLTRVTSIGVPFIDNLDGMYSINGLLDRTWMFIKKDLSAGRWVEDTETAAKVKSLINTFYALEDQVKPARAEFERQREIAAAEDRRARTRERRQIAQSTITRARRILQGISAADQDIIKNWVLTTATKVEFLIPCGEIDSSGYKDYKKAEELTDMLDRKRGDFFNNYGLTEADFLDDMHDGKPVTMGDVILKWRNATTIVEKNLSNYSLWAVSGTMFLKDTLKTAPEPVIELIEAAKRLTARDPVDPDHPEETDTALDLSEKVVHSSVFCHAVLLGLFEGNFNFLGGTPEAVKEPQTGKLTGLDPTSDEEDEAMDELTTTVVDADDDYDKQAEDNPLGQDFDDPDDWYAED